MIPDRLLLSGDVRNLNSVGGRSASTGKVTDRLLTKSDQVDV